MLRCPPRPEAINSEHAPGHILLRESMMRAAQNNQ